MKGPSKVQRPPHPRPQNGTLLHLTRYGGFWTTNWLYRQTVDYKWLPPNQKMLPYTSCLRWIPWATFSGTKQKRSPRKHWRFSSGNNTVEHFAITLANRKKCSNRSNHQSQVRCLISKQQANEQLNDFIMMSCPWVCLPLRLWNCQDP